jgi:hypothetical protein
MRDGSRVSSRWRSPSAVMRPAPESPQRSCGGYESDRRSDHSVREGQRFLHNFTPKNLILFELDFKRFMRISCGFFAAPG